MLAPFVIWNRASLLLVIENMLVITQQLCPTICSNAVADVRNKNKGNAML